ncbi:MAG: hypothetical protein NTY77_10265 [Elusimicrobia bacterium]|nr:hypothetical protein [Elusimicrobiota bacterium]
MDKARRWPTETDSECAFMPPVLTFNGRSFCIFFDGQPVLAAFRLPGQASHFFDGLSFPSFLKKLSFVLQRYSHRARDVNSICIFSVIFVKT